MMASTRRPGHRAGSCPGAVALLAALLALGCTPGSSGGSGGNGGGGGLDGGTPEPDPDPDPEAEALAGRIAAYYCDLVDNCAQSSTEFGVIRQFIDAGGDCEAWFAASLGSLPGGLAGGELVIDEAAFDRCVQRSVESCLFLDEVPDCQEAVTGMRASDDPCTGSDECAPGLYCDYDGGPGIAGECNDICAPRRAAGESCEEDDECAGGPDQLGLCRFADPGDFEGTCARVGIGARAGADAPCGLVEEGGALTRVACADGHYCDQDLDAESGTCRPTPTEGEPCAGSGTPCVGGICVFGACTALEIGSEAGAPCDPRMLQICNPLAGLVCVDGACVATDGSLGAPCSDDDFSPGCDEGLYCGEDGACQRQLADGEPCDGETGYIVCASNYCEVDGDAGTCAPNPFDRAICE